MSNLSEQAKSLREGALTVPNLLSMIRIVLVPFILVFFLKEHYLTAILLVVLSGVTDFLDGKIARKFNQISNLGKMLDPLADKLTQITLAICYFFAFRAMAEPLHSFAGIFWFYVAKELAMILGAVYLLSKNFRPAPANWYGKVATFAYYLVMILLLCIAPEFGAFSRWYALPPIAIIVLVSLSVVLTIMAFVSYLPGVVKQLKEPEEAASEQD